MRTFFVGGYLCVSC